MKPRTTTSLFAAACIAAASAAHALPLTDHASFELFAGGNAAMPGTIRGQLRPSGETDPTVYHRLNFDELYRHSVSGGAEFDYAFDSHLSAFARAAYSQFVGANREIGSTSLVNAPDAPIDARFSDSNAREFDLGARYVFSPGEKWRPFLGAALGATRSSAVSAMVDTTGSFPSTRVELAREDTAFQQRLETGVQFSPTRNFDLRLTAAASHVDSGRPSDDPNLALLAIDNASRVVRGHWDFPAEIGGVWHF